MASGMDWLSALLLGGGTFAKQVGDAGEFTRQERLKQEQLRIDQQRADQLMELQKNQLAQQESQFQRGREPSAKDLLPYLMEAKGKAAAAEREQASRIGQATVLERLGAARPAEMGGALAPGEDPEAAAMIPRTEGAPANQRLQSIAALLKEGPLAEYLVKALGESQQDEFAPISEGSPGLYGKRSGATKMFPAAAAGGMPEARPGFEVEVSTDKNGRQTYHEKRINSGVEHDALARAEGFGSYAQAPPDQQRAINAKILQNRVDVSSAQGAAALSQRPYTDVEQAAFAAHNNILSSISLLKQFSPQEIATYTGLVNRPLAEAKNMLAGLGIADADKRFNEFKPIMGRLQGTAFGEGGKQLTGVELAVVSQYTPTGNERGGAAEVMAKVRNLEAFTKMSRESRMYLAKTGRGAIDADQLDAMIRQKMEAAGMPIPQPNPGWNDSGGASRPQLGEPGYTGVRNEVTRGSAPLGKIMLEGPDGSRVYWPEKRPIPPGARRID